MQFAKFEYWILTITFKSLSCLFSWEFLFWVTPWFVLQLFFFVCFTNLKRGSLISSHTHTYILLSRFYFFYSHFNRYNIVFLAFTYGIPMVVMIICYTVMGRELWGSQSIGETSERQTESVKSKKRLVWNIYYIFIWILHSPCSFFLPLAFYLYLHIVSELKAIYIYV